MGRAAGLRNERRASLGRGRVPRLVLTFLVILVVSAALVAGAVWGIYGTLSDRVEGFLIALAGGALIISAVLELIDPATEQTSVWAVSLAVLAGTGLFTGLDKLVKSRSSGGSGGLLVAITLDGIPENLALGVALISAGPLGAAALSGSILLSNLPEAAGGAKAMTGDGRSRREILLLWTATAALLSAAAVLGNLALSGIPDAALALARAFAGGAVVGSLAIEVFPKAFKQDSYAVGPAVATGLVLALLLTRVG